MHSILRLLVFALVVPALAVSQDTQNAVLLSGKYSDLHPEQKRLVDDWFRRFSAVIKTQVSPEEGYDNLPVSSKTTFTAITHALLRTPLTDDSGASLGATAMSLISGIDQLLGKIEGEGGDKQFRVYVTLIPNALEILEKSREFNRGHDNTVYHKGFPMSYRGTGTPSIQISISKDGKRADIDVDYRSSKFPVALINGHLNSANSDIRAGNNDERHNAQWAGVSNWWRSLLGLPLAAVQNIQTGGAEDTVPKEPKTKANARPEEAIHDFLQFWLVERKPQEALAYMSDAAMSCMEIEQGKPVDRGVARFAMLMGLRQINEAIGPIKDLSEAVGGTTIERSRIRALDQPYRSQFTLYDVREDFAEQFNCVNRLDPSLISEKAARSTSFGKYVGAVFYLKTPKGEKGETVATLWTKQNKHWKLISYATESKAEAARLNSISAPVAVEASATDPGDPQLLNAAKDFLQKWFVRRRVNEAFPHFSTRVYACANLYRNEEDPEPSLPADQRIRAGMERLITFAGKAGKLNDAITAPEVSHPDVRIVEHPDSAAFAIAAIPDAMGAQTDCSKIKPGEELTLPANQGPVPQGYGRYYAMGFHMTKATDEPPVLWIVWTREENQWKIVAYHIVTP